MGGICDWFWTWWFIWWWLVLGELLILSLGSCWYLSSFWSVFFRSFSRCCRFLITLFFSFSSSRSAFVADSLFSFIDADDDDGMLVCCCCIVLFVDVVVVVVECCTDGICDSISTVDSEWERFLLVWRSVKIWINNYDFNDFFVFRFL